MSKLVRLGNREPLHNGTNSILRTSACIRLLVLIAAVFTSGEYAVAKTWGTATSTNSDTGRVIIFRYLSEFDPGFVRAKQHVRVIITWKYKGNNGMPALDQRKRMDELEDLLGPAVEAGGFSSLALVSTGEDLREWIYYAKSENGFLTRMNKALSERPAYPIEIHIADDPTWQNYQEFIDGLKH